MNTQTTQPTQPLLTSIENEDLTNNVKIFKIEKYYQGGMTLYYSLLPKHKKIKKHSWEYQLQEWGENTNGGHCYGYNIKAKKVKTIPDKATQLHFNEDYIT